MTPIFLLSCGKEKRTYSCKAKNLYCSSRFIDTRRFVEHQNSDWYILSAKYGLLDPNIIIEPYDYSNFQKTSLEQYFWADTIVKALLKIYTAPQTFVILAEDSYSITVSEILQNHGFQIVLPYHNLSYNDQKVYFERATDRIDNVKRLYNNVYNVAEKTGGIKLFKDCDGKKYWPQKGLYFIFDMSESCFIAQKPNKIIRIGTHAVSKGSKSTLWHRLKTHKGLNNGGGAHRSSVFRLHIGNALINKHNLHFPTWAIGQSASMETRKTEEELEQLVSEYISKLGIVVLDIDDPSSATSDRAIIEKNTIALLSCINYSFDFSSTNWLGHYSNKQEIRKSSLWNVNYCNSDFDNVLFTLLDKYVDTTISRYYER